MSKTFSQILPVVYIKERNRYVAYSPVLDLSTSGDTIAQAQKRFAEAVEIFFEEIEKSGTTSEILSGLGWYESGNKMIAPKLVSEKSQTVRVPINA